jgi:tRNA-specific 2-thiouridylase
VLSKLMLPLGELTKDEVRELAGQSSLNTATKKESQDICFVPDGDYAGFIERFTGIIPPEGDFVLRDGTVIGRHKGLIRYTVGQHKKLGLGIHIPYYVTAKNAQRNEIILGSSEDLFAREVRAVDVSFMAFDKLDAPLRVKAKLRYRHTEQDAWVYPEEDGVRVVFDEAQRAPTPGQAVVFYDGDVVLGGGKII